GILVELYGTVLNVLRGARVTPEFVFVNDGSADGSAAILDRLAAHDRNVVVVHLSRNFGHQAAVQAGLEYATGDAVVVMDADMQDDPEAIRRFLEEWRRGYDIVYAVRVKRKESFLKRFSFGAFYRFLGVVANDEIPLDAGNFGLIDRVVCGHLNSLPERDRYYSGLRSWVGFKQKGIEVERGVRYDDTPRVSFLGLFRLAQTAIISFSTFPLTIFILIGILAMATCGGVTAFAIYHKLFTDLAIPGWASFLLTASFFGALNAFGIGILGEYVIRIYNQVRRRPMFIVSACINHPVRSYSDLPAQPERTPAERAVAGR
ncbi:MAG: glycosyltransferase family 2 protein, partial [bacterium]